MNCVLIKTALRIPEFSTTPSPPKAEGPGRGHPLHRGEAGWGLGYWDMACVPVPFFFLIITEAFFCSVLERRISNLLLPSYTSMRAVLGGRRPRLSANIVSSLA